MFIYKQNMDATLLKNELSSLKVELLSTQIEVKKLIVSLENSANLAQQSSTVSDIVVSEPSLFTYQNGLVVLSVILVFAMYSLQSVDNITETIINSHNTQVDSLRAIIKLSITAQENCTARIISQQLETRMDLLEQMDHIVKNINITPISTVPLDAAATVTQNLAILLIVDIATASV